MKPLLKMVSTLVPGLPYTSPLFGSRPQGVWTLGRTKSVNRRHTGARPLNGKDLMSYELTFYLIIIMNGKSQQH